MAPGTVRPVDIGGHEYVVWRGADGRLRSVPRACPHLDHDLAEGHVSGDELVCPGHAWAFDGDGNAFKRNEFGRIDPKGSVPTLVIVERDGSAQLELR
ncbi:MAG TPA: Rieske (2Fe-2S) protein [Acidimicrobiia bacterium]|nr:Rieske (2Fe-2S) protein [Acidimicrobiia bacterium]